MDHNWVSLEKNQHHTAELHQLPCNKVLQDIMHMRQILRQLKTHLSIINDDFSTHGERSQKLQCAVSELRERSEKFAVMLMNTSRS